MTFLWAGLLWLLIVVPILVGIYVWVQRRRRPGRRFRGRTGHRRDGRGGDGEREHRVQGTDGDPQPGRHAERCDTTVSHGTSPLRFKAA